MKIHITQAYLKQPRWLVFAVRVTFIEHNLSIVRAFVEHNRKIFGAVQHSIIGTFFEHNRLSPSMRLIDHTPTHMGGASIKGREQ